MNGGRNLWSWPAPTSYESALSHANFGGTRRVASKMLGNSDCKDANISLGMSSHPFLCFLVEQSINKRSWQDPGTTSLSASVMVGQHFW